MQYLYIFVSFYIKKAVSEFVKKNTFYLAFKFVINNFKTTYEITL